jgi:hypothetical protein
MRSAQGTARDHQLLVHVVHDWRSSSRLDMSNSVKSRRRSEGKEQMSRLLSVAPCSGVPGKATLRREAADAMIRIAASQQQDSGYR